MKDVRMRRAVPYIPQILDAQRRKEYVPSLVAEKIRVLPEEANVPPILDGKEGKKDTPIEVLIIAKKAGEAFRALQDVRHRLRRNSTIVLLHNGMGVLQKIQECWLEKDRPNILEGFSTHGISKRADFNMDHWGQGMIHLAIAPRLDEDDIFTYQTLKNGRLRKVINEPDLDTDFRLKALAGSKKYDSLLFAIQRLLSSKTLRCTLRAYIPDFYLIQFRRTILQSILQTLGALQRCTNAELIENKINHKIIGKLVTELLPVLQQDPLISSPTYLEQFSFRQLYEQLRYMALASPNHMNALLQDLVGKRETEMAYHSGFLLRLAGERGLKMPTWRSLHELVRAAAVLEKNRWHQFVPIKGEGVEDEPEWMRGVTEGSWEVERLRDSGVTRRPYPVEMLDEALDGSDDEDSEADDQPLDEHPIEEEEQVKRAISLAERLKRSSSEERLEEKKRPLIPVSNIASKSGSISKSADNHLNSSNQLTGSQTVGNAIPETDAGTGGAYPTITDFTLKERIGHSASNKEWRDHRTAPKVRYRPRYENRRKSR
jgi:2-dehydropantoate 2-reductase